MVEAPGFEQLVERRPARHRADRVDVAAVGLVAVRPAHGAQAGAVRAAQRRQRQLEQDRLPHHGLEVELLAPEREDVLARLGVAVLVELAHLGVAAAPATGSRQRRHAPATARRPGPVTTMPSVRLSSTTSTSMRVARQGREESTTRRPSAVGRRRADVPSGVPGRRSSSATFTTSARRLGAAMVRTGPGRRRRSPSSSWLGLGLLLADADVQPLAPGVDGARQLVEHDLEAAEALVAEVLDLVAHAAGLVVGPLDDLAGPQLGGPDHLGALHHALGLGPRRVEDVVALAARLGEELLALLQQPPGLLAARRAGG